jgi:hypothetical protein
MACAMISSCVALDMPRYGVLLENPGRRRETNFRPGRPSIHQARRFE